MVSYHDNSKIRIHIDQIHLELGGRKRLIEDHQDLVKEQVFGQANRILNKVRLPKIFFRSSKNDDNRSYSKKKKMIGGKQGQYVSGSCIYIVSRLNGKPITLLD